MNAALLIGAWDYGCTDIMGTTTNILEDKLDYLESNPLNHLPSYTTKDRGSCVNVLRLKNFNFTSGLALELSLPYLSALPLSYDAL